MCDLKDTEILDLENQVNKLYSKIKDIETPEKAKK